METASHFIRKDCLQIQISRAEISSLIGEGCGSLLKGSSTKVLEMHQDSEKAQLIKKGEMKLKFSSTDFPWIIFPRDTAKLWMMTFTNFRIWLWFKKGSSRNRRPTGRLSPTARVCPRCRRGRRRRCQSLWSSTRSSLTTMRPARSTTRPWTIARTRRTTPCPREVLGRGI